MTRDDSPVRAWLDEVSTPDYWRRLVPHMSVGESVTTPAVVSMDASRCDEVRGAMLTEGYLQLPPVIPVEAVTAMRSCIEVLQREAIPLGFAYVYDTFWQLGGWLRELLGTLLGDDFVQLPDMWAWCVEPGLRGWEPHREKGAESLLPSGYPKSLSVWVPLTDATPLNGCMYIVPADRDPDYNTAADAVAVHSLQDVRALPAPAGSVLLWNQALLHWGGSSSSRAPTPRISFSIEFQRGDVAPFNQPLLNVEQPPAFDRRLGLVGKQLLQYEHMFDAHPQLLELGRLLVTRFV